MCTYLYRDIVYTFLIFVLFLYILIWYKEKHLNKFNKFKLSIIINNIFIKKQQNDSVYKDVCLCLSYEY